MNAQHDVRDVRTRPRWRWIALLVGGAMILGVVGVVLWLTILRSDAPTQEYRRPNPPVSLPTAYYQVVEEQIAQGLGSSVAQVKAEIRADPGEGLFGVATTQGVSPDQLYTIEIAAHERPAPEWSRAASGRKPRPTRRSSTGRGAARRRWAVT